MIKASYRILSERLYWFFFPPNPLYLILYLWILYLPLSVFLSAQGCISYHKVIMKRKWPCYFHCGFKKKSLNTRWCNFNPTIISLLYGRQCSVKAVSSYYGNMFVHMHSPVHMKRLKSAICWKWCISLSLWLKGEPVWLLECKKVSIKDNTVTTTNVHKLTALSQKLPSHMKAVWFDAQGEYSNNLL